jgi:hypothetical protein
MTLVLLLPTHWICLSMCVPDHCPLPIGPVFYGALLSLEAISSKPLLLVHVLHCDAFCKSHQITTINQTSFLARALLQSSFVSRKKLDTGHTKL